MKASCFNQGGVVKTRQTSVYFPLLPGSTGTNVFHFNMISLLISNVAPRFCDFHEEGAHIFYGQRLMQETTQRIIKLLGLLLPDLSIKKSSCQTLL